MGAFDYTANGVTMPAHSRDANIQFSKCLMILRFKEKNA